MRFIYLLILCIGLPAYGFDFKKELKAKMNDKEGNKELLKTALGKMQGAAHECNVELLVDRQGKTTKAVVNLEKGVVKKVTIAEMKDAKTKKCVEKAIKKQSFAMFKLMPTYSFDVHIKEIKNPEATASKAKNKVKKKSVAAKKALKDKKIAGKKVGGKAAKKGKKAIEDSQSFIEEAEEISNASLDEGESELRDMVTEETEEAAEAVEDVGMEHAEEE